MRKKKKPVLDVEEAQHCQRPWTDYRAQQALEAKNHTEAENAAAREACSKLVRGEFLSWEELLGKR